MTSAAHTSIRILPFCGAVLRAVATGMLVLACMSPLRADAADDAPPRPTKLVVGTMRVPPFVMRSDAGGWSGLSIELWTMVTQEMKAPFEFREYDYDVVGLLNAVERNEVDAAIATIPVTLEGEGRFDYSHTYFTAGLGITTRIQPQGGLLDALASLFSYAALGAIAMLLALLLVIGALVWLLERRQNSHFDPRPLHGVADGVWWAAVTMTTTGFGDKVPVSWRGRLVAMVWMFASIFLTAFFSATLASSFVVGRLKTGVTGPADLPSVRVAVVSNTAGEQWLEGQRLSARAYPFVIQASKALQRGDVDALIYEKPILGHMVKEFGWRNLQILPHTLAVREYAIALPSGSPNIESINRALLKVLQRPDWKDVVHRYVGSVDQIAQPDK